jgi:hypothetical protein
VTIKTNTDAKKILSTGSEFTSNEKQQFLQVILGLTRHDSPTAVVLSRKAATTKPH